MFASAGAAPATTVTIGGASTGNCFPFEACATGSYQQVYSSAAFSGPISITGLTFFSYNGGGAISGNFTLDFSITSDGVNGLSVNQASNVGFDSAQFFSGAVTNTYSFNGTPYVYDPSLGNLLLTVTGHGTGSGYLESGVTSDTSRAYTNSVSHVNTVDSEGLETQFTGSPVAVTPEPSSLLLLGTGLAAATGLVRRRRAQAL